VSLTESESVPVSVYVPVEPGNAASNKLPELTVFVRLSVPEPSSTVLPAAGLGLLARRRRRASRMTRAIGGRPRGGCRCLLRR
jgi:PEP-CTERM motif